MHITTIGLDLAKNIFQVHGVTEDGSIAFNKPLRRARVLPFFAKLEPCLIGIEACSSAHYWGRELRALGHEVSPILLSVCTMGNLPLFNPLLSR